MPEVISLRQTSVSSVRGLHHFNDYFDGIGIFNRIRSLVFGQLYNCGNYMKLSLLK